MSNEIVLSLTVNVRNGYLVEQFAPGQILIDQDDPQAGGYTQTIGTGAEEIDFGDIDLVDGGVLVLRNLDDTNAIDVGPAVGGTGPFDTTLVEMIRLYPGQPTILMLHPDAVIAAQANVTSCLLSVRIYPFHAVLGT